MKKLSFKGLFGRILILFSFFSLFAMNGFAQDVKNERAKEIFHKKFKVLRDESGKISAVVYKMGAKSFSANAIMNEILTELKSINKQSKEILNSRSSGSAGMSINFANATTTLHEQQVAEAISLLYEDYELGLAKVQGAEYAHPSRDTRIENLRYAMESVQEDGVLNEVQSIANSEHWTAFNSKLMTVLLKIRPDVLSVPNDKTYFFQRELITEVSKLIISQATKYVTSVPFLGMLGQIFSQIEQIIMEQRVFNQNYLLYLLENFSPDTFSLKEDEASKIVSSMYQSRLGMLELWQLRKMSDGDFTTYGWTTFYTQKRNANAVLAKHETKIYDKSQTKRISSAFAIVSENKKLKIVNLFNKAHMFSGKPALAHDFEKPKKVMLTRMLIKLGQMGLGFVPIPGIIKDFANQFASSTYKEQSLTEGALAAYFEMEGHAGLSKHFIRQSVNPFIR